jgi:hypothetical protein
LPHFSAKLVQERVHIADIMLTNVKPQSVQLFRIPGDGPRAVRWASCLSQQRLERYGRHPGRHLTVRPRRLAYSGSRRHSTKHPRNTSRLPSPANAASAQVREIR